MCHTDSVSINRTLCDLSNEINKMMYSYDLLSSDPKVTLSFVLSFFSNSIFQYAPFPRRRVFLDPTSGDHDSVRIGIHFGTYFGSVGMVGLRKEIETSVLFEFGFG